MNNNIFFNNLPIFYINLDRSEDRNKYMIDSFKKNNISLYFRVSGVDGNKLEKTYEQHNLSQQEAGLFFSFKRAIEMFLETDYEYAAIAEDDIDLDISKKITFSFYDTLKYHCPDPYILQCAPLIQNDNYLSTKINKRIPAEDECFWGTALMIINRSFAEKVLNEIFYDEDIHACGMLDWQQQLDYCIYSHAEAYVWTIFTVKNLGSLISNATDHIITNAINNIKNFTNDKKISIEDVFL